MPLLTVIDGVQLWRNFRREVFMDQGFSMFSLLSEIPRHRSYNTKRDVCFIHFMQQ